MSNFTGKINLLKLKKSCVMALKGKESYVKCVVIPIEGNVRRKRPRSEYLTPVSEDLPLYGR